MSDFATFHAATALASDLHAQLEAIRADAANRGGHTSADMEDILMAEMGVERVLRRLLRLTQHAANAEAPVLATAAE
jgi:hypothetical protein